MREYTVMLWKAMSKGKNASYISGTIEKNWNEKGNMEI